MSTNHRSFRLVCSPDEVALTEAMLHAQGYEFEPDPFFAPARRLTAQPRPLGSSLAAFFGRIYIQDRASMLPPVALQPPPGAAVLDMCASPGSKTGQLAGMVGASGLVLGNEPAPARLATLRRNLLAMGLFQTATCCSPGESLPLADHSWQHILLDPPCSGWGTVERNPKVLAMWKDHKVLPLIHLQRALLREAARLLRPGGVMAYSTCTTNPEENEQQVLFAQEQLGLRLEPLPPLPGFSLRAPLHNCAGVWRLDPLPGDTQGFFVARLRKPDADTPPLLAGPGASLRYDAVPSDALLAQGVAPALFPGPVGIFGDSLHVLPELALRHLPATLRWQGLYCGKTSRNNDIRLSPRLRLPGPGARIDLQGQAGLGTLSALLQGQSIPLAQIPGEITGSEDAKSALLCWNTLKLGRVGIKNKRLLWSER